jgi:hypothetical protein
VLPGQIWSTLLSFLTCALDMILISCYRHLVNVRQLNISDNQKIANGEYLGHLTSLTNLQTLYLEDVSFSPKFVCQLSGLSSLRQLSISLLWNDQNVGYFTCFDNLRSLGKSMIPPYTIKTWYYSGNILNWFGELIEYFF